MSSSEKRPFCLRRGYRRESFIHESANFLLTTPLCCNAVNSLNRPKFRRGKGPGRVFIRLWMISEREERAELSSAAIPQHQQRRPCLHVLRYSMAPIVSQIIPTLRWQPAAFSSYTAGPAGGEMLLPNSWGTSRESSGGRRGAAPLGSIHPLGSSPPADGSAGRTRSERGEPHGAQTPSMGLVLPKFPKHPDGSSTLLSLPCLSQLKPWCG